MGLFSSNVLGFGADVHPFEVAPVLRATLRLCLQTSASGFFEIQIYCVIHLLRALLGHMAVDCGLLQRDLVSWPAPKGRQPSDATKQRGHGHVNTRKTSRDFVRGKNGPSARQEGSQSVTEVGSAIPPRQSAVITSGKKPAREGTLDS